MSRAFDRENCRLTRPKLYIPIHVLFAKKNICPGLVALNYKKKDIFSIKTGVSNEELFCIAFFVKKSISILVESPSP